MKKEEYKDIKRILINNENIKKVKISSSNGLVYIEPKNAAYVEEVIEQYIKGVYFFINNVRFIIHKYKSKNLKIVNFILKEV